MEDYWTELCGRRPLDEAQAEAWVARMDTTMVIRGAATMLIWRAERVRHECQWLRSRRTAAVASARNGRSDPSHHGSEA